MTDASEKKIVLDPVHGVIELDPLAVQIIDTKEFQRLRFIKQLGCIDYVYPGATHTRFAHSIGVYHLACQMIDGLRRCDIRDDSIKLEPWEEECIRIAALCRGLGHGPFSRIYEEICQETYGQGCRWKHQDLSCRIVKRIFNRYPEIQGQLQNGIKSICLIMKLIIGKKIKKMTNDEKKKAYMFQIVSNKENSIDVDKWDYLCRDAMYCGMHERFLSERAILGARIVLTSKTGEPPVHQIGYPEKDAWMFYSMFQVRITLHRYVYQHRVIVSINLMVKDILKASGSESLTQGCELFPVNPYPVKTTMRISEEDQQLESYINADTQDDEANIDTYMRLTDHIISPIRYIRENNGSQHERPIGKAVELIQNIDSRRFYKMHRELHLKSGIVHTDAIKAKEDCIKMMEKKIENFSEKVAVVLICFDYDMGDKNPMDRVTFYNKRVDPNNVIICSGTKLPKHKVSHLLTDVFSDYYIRIYLKTGDIAANIEEILKELARKYDTESGEAETLHRHVKDMTIAGDEKDE